MDSVVVMQARTSSSRLPAKVLLPLGGVPMAILACKRAGNNGRRVLLVTSSDSSDDCLVDLAVSQGIECFRGSLVDVLGRVVSALANFSDETLVFRLTADNVFPDGALLDEVEREFLKRSVEYLCCNGKGSGLPYGVSVELTRLKHLRVAENKTVEPSDREHVTPYIQRKFGTCYFRKYESLNAGHYWATVDCLDDYLRIERVFAQVPNPFNVNFLDLVSLLRDAPDGPVGKGAVTKLVLGTAQFGLNYGITNRHGQPGRTTAVDLIKKAISSGAQYIDTARAYGASEDIVGEVLAQGWQARVKVITKLSPLLECPANADAHAVRKFVDASIYESCTRLKTPSLDVLMLHRAQHLNAWEGTVWVRLMELREAGVIKALGVSVQNPDELQFALNEPFVTYIQMPFNIIDTRWEGSISRIKEVKAKRQISIHVRSALLQGLLTSRDERLWHIANVNEPEGIIGWLNQMCARAGKSSVADLCLGYLNSLDWIDGIVVGVDSNDQLISNIISLSDAGLTVATLAEIETSRPWLSDSTLNPVNWKST